MKDKKLQSQVEEIVKSDVPNRHTFFQLNFFILGKEPTHQAKLKRCVEELQAKKRSIESMVLEIDDLKDKNELIYLEINRGSFLDNQERDIKIRMLERKIFANNKAIDELESKVKFYEEEMIFFVEAFNRLKEIEKPKQWDDFEVQTEYWNAKLADEINHRLLLQLPIDVEIVKTALAMPSECQIRRQLMALLHKQTEKLLSKDAISIVA